MSEPKLKQEEWFMFTSYLVAFWTNSTALQLLQRNREPFLYFCLESYNLTCVNEYSILSFTFLPQIFSSLTIHFFPLKLTLIFLYPLFSGLTNGWSHLFIYLHFCQETLSRLNYNIKSRSLEDTAMNSGDLSPCCNIEYLTFCVRHLGTQKPKKG